MDVTFVGHASVLLESHGVGLLSDPWTTGSAFNDAWLPYPTPQLPSKTLDRVTHLWISHEHPDHLSIPTLRSIPPERRREITVLYQRHWSGLTASFLRTLGFRAVVELAHNQVFELHRDVLVRLLQVGHEDAALAVHAGGQTVLNLNDCKPTDGLLKAMKSRVGDLDLLLDQFSIAGWPGNPGDAEAHQRASQRTLELLGHHADALQPRMLLPFASFVRFAHVDNHYMNDAANNVADVVDAAVHPQVAAMYPGDTAPLGDLPGLTAAAAARYDADRRALDDQPLMRHEPAPVGDVAAAASEFVSDVRRSYHQPVVKRVPPIDFVLTDGDADGQALRIDLAAGRASLIEVSSAGATRVELSTQAALHTFTQRWGLPTLLISGRFRLHGDPQPFSRLKQLGALYSNQIRTRGAVRDLLSYRSTDLLVRRGPQAWKDLLGRVA